MRRRLGTIAGITLVGAGGLIAGGRLVAAQDPLVTFRSSANSVSVDVSVRRQNRPVIGLIATDFEVYDNGVQQEVADVSYEKLPIDVTVELDISASVTGGVLDQLRRSIQQLRSDLGPADRLKLMAFNMRISRLADFTEPSAAAADRLGSVAASGSTAVLDAIAVALATPGPPDRRQLVVVFSDGDDSSSISSPADVIDLAGRSTPTVAVVLASPVARATAALLGRPVSPRAVYSQLAAVTGGAVVSSFPGDDLTSMFHRVLDDFRASYVLHFTPRGVQPSGTHILEVRVRGGVDVRARRGYVWR